MVLGTTAPLYAIVLGYLSRLTALDAPLLSVILSGTSLGLAGALLLLFFPSRRRWIRLVCALLVFFNPLLWKLSATGMESGFFLLLLTVIVVVPSPTVAAVFGAASAFVRPEGALFCIARIALDRSPARPRIIALVVFSVVLGIPLYLVARAYGSAFPHSIIAKGVFFATVFPTGYQSRLALENLLFKGFAHRGFTLLTVVGTLLLLHRPDRWKWLSFPFLSSAIFLFLYARNYPVFPWYLAPLALTTVLLSLTVADGLMDNLKSRGIAFGGCILVPLIIVLSTAGTLSMDRRVISDLVAAQSAQVATTGAAAQWLASAALRDQSILLPEIGLIGYATDMRILDWGGIVSPALAPFIARNDLLGALRAFSPDYIFYMLPRDESSPFHDPSARAWFHEHYAEVARFPREPPLGDYVLFRRNPLTGKEAGNR